VRAASVGKAPGALISRVRVGDPAGRLLVWSGAGVSRQASYVDDRSICAHSA
jgi:hypothetical protein